MKITIVEGTTKITSKKEILYHIFGGNAEFNAVQKNIWVAPKTFIGNYEEIKLPKMEDIFATPHLNIILNFIRADKGHLGNFIDKEFEDNGWHVIDASSLKDALEKLTAYLGKNLADNIYINTHGLESERYVLNENGEAMRDSKSGKYIMKGDTGFHTNNDKILGSHLEQYASDKSKLKLETVNSIENFIGIAKYVKEGKNLIMGSCWSVRYDDLFGIGISSIAKSRDVFVNRDYSSNYIDIGQKNIPFQNFINYNQTSRKNYINGWVWYRDGVATQRNFNIIMTKYGVKTIE